MQTDTHEDVAIAKLDLCSLQTVQHPAARPSFLRGQAMGRFSDAEEMATEAARTAEAVLGKQSEMYAMACENAALALSLWSASGGDADAGRRGVTWFVEAMRSWIAQGLIQRSLAPIRNQYIDFMLRSGVLDPLPDIFEALAASDMAIPRDFSALAYLDRQLSTGKVRCVESSVWRGMQRFPHDAMLRREACIEASTEEHVSLISEDLDPVSGTCADASVWTELLDLLRGNRRLDPEWVLKYSHRMVSAHPWRRDVWFGHGIVCASVGDVKGAEHAFVRACAPEQFVDGYPLDSAAAAKMLGPPVGQHLLVSGKFLGSKGYYATARSILALAAADDSFDGPLREEASGLVAILDDAVNNAGRGE